MPLIEDYHKEVTRVVAEDYHKAVARIIGLEARIDELSRAYAGAGLAIEELTDERDRYLEALKNLRDNIRITSSTVCPNPYLESWLVVIAEALEPTK